MAQNANVSVASQAAAITQIEAQNANLAAAAQAAEIFQLVVNAENKAAEIAVLIPLQRVLHTIVSLTWTQCVAVTADGYEDFMDFENMQWGKINLRCNNEQPQ